MRITHVAKRPLQPKEQASYTADMSEASKQTPMMRQYWRFKAEYPDAVLFFHLGDFYETFFEDAQLVAEALDIVLTSRNGHPMAGVPIRRGEAYMQQLLKLGHRVAVCQQVEDPKDAKGLVKRDVVRVVTPGTVFEDALLDAGASNYLAAVYISSEEPVYGLAFLELSTGEFVYTSVTSEEALRDELVRRAPSEVLCTELAELPDNLEGSFFVSRVPAETFVAPGGMSFELGHEAGHLAAGALQAYIERTQKAMLGHVQPACHYELADQMDLDGFTISSLELVKPLREGQDRGTLRHVLDDASTSMGRRRLRRMILAPLLDRARIEARHDAVEAFLTDVSLRQALREAIRGMHDMERLLGKLGSHRMRPPDLLLMIRSLEMIPSIEARLSEGTSRPSLPQRLQAICEALGSEVHAALCRTYASMLVDQPPVDVRDGDFIRPGYNTDLDQIRSEVRSVRTQLTTMEQTEKASTGIPSLKVGYNRVFGYYLEVTKTHLDKVPEHYVRRQTLANSERFITSELQEFEQRIATSDERAKALEAQLFEAALTDLMQHMSTLQRAADAISELDVFLSLAETAHNYNYVRPAFVEEHTLSIQQGRHPVVERLEEFVPNDLVMGTDCDLVILTGPNMAGKSVYLRQVAMICLMAQMGSFVPATEARLPIVDRVFARVGASDMLVAGISTFMMEMLEVSTILKRATSRSVIILDEMGRGTSTFDGVSIAWAVARELATRVHAKTLFATHYQELTRMADEILNVENLHVSVKEIGKEVVFLHRVVPGVAKGSYGVHVARLAGLPEHVTAAADVILEQLLTEAPLSQLGSAQESADPLPLFGAEDHPVISRLRKIDPNTLTPIEALQLLDELRNQID